jgi:membrane-associated phospholipid phosphatase
MRKIKYFVIPTFLFIMVCGIFLSFHSDKISAQLMIHERWYNENVYQLMKFITGWGEWQLFAVAILAFAFQKSWWRAGEFLTAGIISAVVVQVLKRLVFAPSPRPMAVINWGDTQLPAGMGIDMPLHFAFPSGHTTTAFIWFALMALHWNRPVLQLFSALCAIAVAVSRVYLMVHWITDVMAGALLGVAIAVIVHHTFLRVQKNRSFLRSG